MKTHNTISQISDPKPIQFLHLRFVDMERQSVLNFGGYTLAYNCQMVENNQPTVFYAFSECHVYENYCRKTGRSIAKARLENSAPLLSDSFVLDTLPENVAASDLFLDKGQGVFDVSEKHFDLRGAVVKHFLSASHNLRGTAIALDVDAERFLCGYRGTLCLDSNILDLEDWTHEEQAVDVADTLLEQIAEFVAVNKISNSVYADMFQLIAAGLESIVEVLEGNNILEDLDNEEQEQDSNSGWPANEVSKTQLH